MKSNFIISAFADEISANVHEQIRVLKENNISHVEVRGLDKKPVDFLSIEEAKNYKQLFHENGIKISSIGSTIGKIKIYDDFEEHLELFEHVLKLAEIFESRYIRMFSFFIDKEDNPDQYQKEVIRRWKCFLKAAKRYPNIILLHENEKEIYGDTPERCLKLLNELNTNQLRAVFDPANFVQCDVEVFPKAYEMLKDYIEYLHIKDARFCDHEVTVAGNGDGHVEELLNALVETGYHGFASIEPHLTLFNGFARLEHGDEQNMSDGNHSVRMFGSAVDALKVLLVNKMGQEWK